MVANPAANPWPWHERVAAAEPAAASTPAAVGAPDAPSRASQWQREGLPATLAAGPFARFGVTAHLVGRVLDLRFDGVSEILERDGAEVRAPRARDGPRRGRHVVASVTC